jgi:hypothetical protein
MIDEMIERIRSYGLPIIEDTRPAGLLAKIRKIAKWR